MVKYNVRVFHGAVSSVKMAYAPANYAGKVKFLSLTSSYLSIFDDTYFFYSCSAKVNANSLSIDNKGYTTMVNFCRIFIGNECLIYTIKGFRKDKFHKM